MSRKIYQRAIWLFVYVITDFKVRKFLCDRSLDHQITLEIFEFLYTPADFILQVHIVSHCLLFKVHSPCAALSKGFVWSAARIGATFIYYHAVSLLSTTFFITLFPS